MLYLVAWQQVNYPGSLFLMIKADLVLSEHDLMLYTYESSNLHKTAHLPDYAFKNSFLVGSLFVTLTRGEKKTFGKSCSQIRAFFMEVTTLTTRKWLHARKNDFD